MRSSSIPDPARSSPSGSRSHGSGTLPVSSYEHVLSEVRSLRRRTTRVQRLATTSLDMTDQENDGDIDDRWRPQQKHLDNDDDSLGLMEVLDCSRKSPGSLSDGRMSASSDTAQRAGAPLLYHGTWPQDHMWASEPTHDRIQRNNMDRTEVTSVMSFASSSGAAPLERILPPKNLEVKVDMVYSLLSMLGTSENPDMGETLLALSTNPESSLAMRQAGCLPILVQLIYSEKDSETREKASRALFNLVQVQGDDKLRKREVKVLKLLEEIRIWCNNITSKKNEVIQDHPTQVTENIIKLSFDEGYRQTICELGGVYTLANLIEADHLAHKSENNDPNCILIRRYAGMCLTNLTFGHSENKSLLCSFRNFMKCLVAQLKCENEDLRQVTASVLRNLSWRADVNSRLILRESCAVKTLISAAIISKKESTLKSILSALWNLSAHCSMNKAEICSVEGALGFLVDTLNYQPNSTNLMIQENAGGILRNISSHIAIREDYRAILRKHNCIPMLLQQLKSPSLTIVSNACGTLWNLSAKCAEDQKTLWDLGAAQMLRSLNHSKHLMIATSSRAALKNLLSSRPNLSLQTTLDQTAKELGLPALPTLNARKQKALVKDLQQNLSEMLEIEPSSPLSDKHFAYKNGVETANFDIDKRFKNEYDRNLQDFEETHEILQNSNLSPNLDLDNNRSSTSDFRFQSGGLARNTNQPQTNFEVDLNNSELTSTPVKEKRKILGCGKSGSVENFENEPRNFCDNQNTLVDNFYRLSLNPEGYNSLPSRKFDSRRSFDDDQDFCDEPIDYSQKYSTEKTTKNLENQTGFDKVIDFSPKEVEEPIDFSKKYPETKNYKGDFEPIDYSKPKTSNNGTYKKTQKFGDSLGAPKYKERSPPKSDFTDYAITDLDQPTNYSLRYRENDSDSDECDKPDPRNFYEEQDQIKTYCTEGTPYETPYNFSTATSLSDLRIDQNEIDGKNTKEVIEVAGEKTPSKDKKQSCYSSGLNSPEKPVNYCEEGTPGYFSRVSSLSSLNATGLDATQMESEKEKNCQEEEQVKLEKPETGRNEETKVENKERESGKVVKFGSVVDYAEETPLMFSRSSSLGSLSSTEQHSIHDDRSSVSDFSRLTSGIISPSELPDSPTQTVPPSPRTRKAPIAFPSVENRAQVHQKSVFDDNVTKFKETNTPVEFSTGTSLSSLTIDDEPSIPTKIALLQNGTIKRLEVVEEATSGGSTTGESVRTANQEIIDENKANDRIDLSALSDGEEDGDEDILAACINIGMQNNRHRRPEKPQTSSKLPTSLPKYKSPNQQSQIPKSRLPILENRPLKLEGSLNHDTLKTYCTENTPAMLSHAGSNSDLSVLSITSHSKTNHSNDEKCDLSDESSNMSGDNDNILAECIQSGMPKANKKQIVQPLKSTNNISNRLPVFEAKDEFSNFAVEDSPCQFSLRSSLSDLTIDGHEFKLAKTNKEFVNSVSIGHNSVSNVASNHFVQNEASNLNFPINHGSNNTNSGSVTRQSVNHDPTTNQLHQNGSSNHNFFVNHVLNSSQSGSANLHSVNSVPNGAAKLHFMINHNSNSRQSGLINHQMVETEAAKAQFSLQSSLSDLSVDVKPAKSKKSCFNHESVNQIGNQSINHEVSNLEKVESLSSLSVDSHDSTENLEQALLAQCISSGMPKSRSAVDNSEVTNSKNAFVTSVVKHMTMTTTKTTTDVITTTKKQKLEKYENPKIKKNNGFNDNKSHDFGYTDNSPENQNLQKNVYPNLKNGLETINKCSDVLNDNSILSSPELSDSENQSKGPKNRMLDPDAMIESLDRFTAELVSHSSHLNSHETQNITSNNDNQNNTWDEDTSPNDVSFPSFSISAPLIASFKSDTDSKISNNQRSPENLKLGDHNSQEISNSGTQHGAKKDQTTINNDILRLCDTNSIVKDQKTSVNPFLTCTQSGVQVAEKSLTPDLSENNLDQFSSMSESTIIAMEATRVFNDLSQNMVTSCHSLELDAINPPSMLESLTSLTSNSAKNSPLLRKKLSSKDFTKMCSSLTSQNSLELDNINPPSMMESVTSLTYSENSPKLVLNLKKKLSNQELIALGQSTSQNSLELEITEKSATSLSGSSKNSPLLHKKLSQKELSTNLVRRALANAKSVENLDSFSNLDMVKPPSVMGDYLDMVDMESSITSVASITSEIAENDKDKNDKRQNFMLSQSDYFGAQHQNCGAIGDFINKKFGFGRQRDHFVHQVEQNVHFGDFCTDKIGLDDMNPPSLMNDVTDLNNSTADILTENIYSETEIFEDCFTHTIDQTLQNEYLTADEITEQFSDANSITPIQSDFGSSSAESSPKKQKSINKRLTPKQKRQLAKERYKTYTVAAEMLTRSTENFDNQMSPDFGKLSENSLDQLDGSCHSSGSNSPKLTPKERRQLHRERFQTRVLEIPDKFATFTRKNEKSIEINVEKNDYQNPLESGTTVSGSVNLGKYQNSQLSSETDSNLGKFGNNPTESSNCGSKFGTFTRKPDNSRIVSRNSTNSGSSEGYVTANCSLQMSLAKDDKFGTFTKKMAQKTPSPSPKKEKVSPSSPKSVRTKTDIRKSMQQKRLENSERFRTRTLSSEQSSNGATPSPEPHNRELSLEELHNMLENETKLILTTLEHSNAVDDLLDCETLSLVSNDDDSETNSLSSVNYRTYHKSWSLNNKNLPVIESQICSTNLGKNQILLEVGKPDLGKNQIPLECGKMGLNLGRNQNSPLSGKTSSYLGKFDLKSPNIPKTNLPVSRPNLSISKTVTVAAVSCQNIPENPIEPQNSLEKERITPKPKIVKPGSQSSENEVARINSLEGPESPKAIRGKKKVYVSPYRNQNLSKPKTINSNLVKNVTSTLTRKAPILINRGSKLVSPSVKSPQKTQNRTSLPVKSVQSSPQKRQSLPPKVERQGTFVMKEQNSPKSGRSNSNLGEIDQRSLESNQMPEGSGKPGTNLGQFDQKSLETNEKPKSKIARAINACKSKSATNLKSPKLQSKIITSTTKSRSTLSSRSPSSDRDFSSKSKKVSSTGIQPSSSSQSLKYSSKNLSSSSSLNQRSNSNVSISSNESTKKKQVTSKIASLWKKIEDSKKKQNTTTEKVDKRVWITPNKRTNCDSTTF